MENHLRQYIRLLLFEAKEKKRNLTLTAQNRNDLELALQWLRLNKLIKSGGKIGKSGDKHKVSISVSDKARASYMVKDRFGTFIGVS